MRRHSRIRRATMLPAFTARLNPVPRPASAFPAGLAQPAAALLLAALLAGCAGGSPYATGWDGRRGYDGNGDYGYDLEASRAEARGYRARAARAYAVPGTPEDPWGPYIREAASRFRVPETWIREVMRQESGGRLYDADGRPITSSAGAMGLMQVMPFHFQQGEDPYDPQTNVRKGAQILKDNYERIKQKRPDLPDDVAWEYAAAAYLGAFDWNRVEPTNAADAYGTTGPAYIAKFRQARSHYRQLLGSQAGSAAGGKFAATAVTGGQAYPVTQGYGATEFAQGSGMYRDHFHHGVDLGVPQGTKITAPTGGTVVFAGDAGDGYGVKVVVKLDNGYTIFVGHLSQTSVQNGQRVDAGTVLGLSGNTGASTGPHLHLGVIGPDGKERDPSELFVF